MTWLGWVLVLGVVGAMGAPGRAHGAEPSTPSPKSWYNAPFDFIDFGASQQFRLNTLPTTLFGRPWADILVKPENLLRCKGASVALCYYSGPETPASPQGLATPCTLLPGGNIANCTCYEIPAGPTYMVDINAILNLDVYLETVKVCGDDGSRCSPNGTTTAPVCNAINNNTLITRRGPGLDLQPLPRTGMPAVSATRTSGRPPSRRCRNWLRRRRRPSNTAGPIPSVPPRVRC